MRRFLCGCVLLTAVLVGESCFCLAPGAATEEKALWVGRMANLDETARSTPHPWKEARIEVVGMLPGHKVTAEGWGPFLMELDPEFSLAIIEEVWPRLTTPGVKTGFLKAFFDAPHPYFHRALHLGMTDPDSVVREYATKYLEKIAFRTFGDEDRDDYLLWYKECRDRSVEDVIRGSYLLLVKRLKDLDRTAGIAVLKDTRTALWRWNHDSLRTLKRQCVTGTGLVDVVESWLEDPDALPDEIENALYIWRGVVSEPGREFVERVIIPLTQPEHPLKVRCAAIETLGLPGNEWALPVLLEFAEETRPYWQESSSDEERDRIRKEDPETWEQLREKAGFVLSVFEDIQPSDEQIRRDLVPLLRRDFPSHLRLQIVRMIGESHLPDAADLLLEPLVRFERLISGRESLSPYYCDILKEIGDPRAIPTLIGIIDADNSEDAIRLGEYLFLMEGMDYWSRLYDGAWWRRWWEENKSRYPEEVRKIPIPDLPKTEHGKTYTPFPKEMFTNEGLMEYLIRYFKEGNLEMVEDLYRLLDWRAEERAIPLMIGIIDAVNPPSTIEHLDCPLAVLTGVGCSRSPRDGTWWRRWWELNRHHLPEDIREIPIPDLPKVECEEEDQPTTDQPVILELPDAGSAAGRMIQLFKERDFDMLCNLADELAERDQAWTVPLMIGLINSDNTPATIGGFGDRALPKLTGVEYDESHDIDWWAAWWEENKSQYPEAVQELGILPDPYDSTVIEPWLAKANASRDGFVQFSFYPQGRPEPPEEVKVQAEPEIPEATDVADIPSRKMSVAGDTHKRYFLIGPKQGSAAPDGGYKLLVVLPGGDGDAAFHPFVKRVYKHALGEDCVVAQLVAVKWRPWQRKVWPSRHDPVPGKQFSTEEFVDAVIADVKTGLPINEAFVFQLAWSSSGPAAYCISVQENTPITGSYVAMSTFYRDWVPRGANVRGHPYFLLHSPEDEVCHIRHARRARDALTQAGGNVRLVPYQGGHGWHEDVYGNIREGIEWLEGNSR